MAIKTILFKTAGEFRKEKVAAAGITPGMLIERTSADKVQVHSSAGQNAQRMFAVENDLEGKDIDHAYVADERCQFVVCRPGDEVFALLADGQNVSIGDWLESNGDGYLRKHTVAASAGEEYTECIVAQAISALDLSGGSSGESTQRIKVEVM